MLNSAVYIFIFIHHIQVAKKKNKHSEHSVCLPVKDFAITFSTTKGYEQIVWWTRKMYATNIMLSVIC